jgi:arylsulfatase A-like enzyme
MILTGTEPMTMVRERWKLVQFVDSDQSQLFDLRADPDEPHNLCPDEETPRRSG